LANLPTNQAVVVSQKITAALFKLLEAFIEQAGESYQPWLRAPVVKQIFELVVQKLSEKISLILQEDEALLIISFQSAMDKKHYQDALDNLRKGDDPDALKKAREAADAIIHWPGGN